MEDILIPISICVVLPIAVISLYRRVGGFADGRLASQRLDRGDCRQLQASGLAADMRHVAPDRHQLIRNQPAKAETPRLSLTVR